MKIGTILFTSLLFLVFTPLFISADEQAGLSNGQTIYVPAYSHIYSGNRERIFQLTITLSVRNIDMRNPINITSIEYQSQQHLLKKLLEAPTILNSLESKRFIIPQSEEKGGSGAYFIVQWKSDQLVNSPIVESIMIGTQNQQGISFTSRGRAINQQENSRSAPLK
ncbi:DUF3124 domain-containing protein [bacterium]|nr:DUF3124 domain-containing protein [bacterium]